MKCAQCHQEFEPGDAQLETAAGLWVHAPECSEANAQSNLSQGDKRIKIAEACGWELKEVSYKLFGELGLRYKFLWVLNHKEQEELPDFFNDLNAMNAAEKVLTEDQRFDYGNELYRIVERALKDSKAVWWVISATASQRAEAFGLTLNLW